MMKIFISLAIFVLSFSVFAETKSKEDCSDFIAFVKVYAGKESQEVKMDVGAYFPEKFEVRVALKNCAKEKEYEMEFDLDVEEGDIVQEMITDPDTGEKYPYGYKVQNRRVSKKVDHKFKKKVTFKEGEYIIKNLDLEKYSEKVARKKVIPTEFRIKVKLKGQSNAVSFRQVTLSNDSIHE